jgi:hypothetical protein
MFVPPPLPKINSRFCICEKHTKPVHEQLWQGLPARPRISDLPTHFKTQSWFSGQSFCCWLVEDYLALVLFETLMQGSAKKHRPLALALCRHTSLQAFWLVSKK